MAGNKDNGMYYMGNDNLPNRNWQGEYTPEKIAALKKAKKRMKSNLTKHIATKRTKKRKKKTVSVLMRRRKKRVSMLRKMKKTPWKQHKLE